MTADKNLAYVEECEAHRTVRALGEFSVFPDKVYHRTHGGTVSLRDCPDKGAAERARTAAKASTSEAA